MFQGIKNVSIISNKNKILNSSLFQLFFNKQKKEQDESQITEEFNVTNTLIINKELENEPDLDYEYEDEEEEEEEDDVEDNEENKKDKDNKDKDNIDNANKDENKQKEEKDIENKEDIKEQSEISTKSETKESENIDNINNNSSDNNENIIESEKAPIIEEIDTTIPKNIDNNNNKINLDEPHYSSEDNNQNNYINPNIICHRLIPKGSDIDISKRIYFKCYKLKAKSNIISFLTGAKKIKIPYIIFFDENFYYMSKDKLINDKNKNIRRIGNKYDLTKLSNFQIRKINEEYEFAFEFTKDDFFDRTYKLLYFEQKDAEIFSDYFQQYINDLDLEENPSNIIDIKNENNIDNDNNIQNENEDEENEEEEEDDNEQNEENEDNKGDNEDNKDKKDDKEKEKDIKEKKEINNDIINDAKEKNNEEIISTKEESKEIREVEVIN